MSISGRAAVLVALALAAGRARADSQASIAARENAEGEKLLAAKKPAQASEKFRDAAARVPEPRYFYNLCDSLDQEGKFGDAITACNAAIKAGPSPYDARAKALIEKIKDEARRQKIELAPR
ncbi:MAG TPA: hypothetical protein VLX92_21865 [Kofleriaceae bacterium]|nr:hypothetical protein [Kofleriaceae bacterium]